MSNMIWKMLTSREMHFKMFQKKFMSRCSAYKVVRIYAKSQYTDHPGKFHQKMVCKTPKKP